MPAFSVHLQPSRLLTGICVVLHLAAGVLAWCLFDNRTAWFTVPVVLAAGVWSLHGVSLRSSNAINTILVNAHGQAVLLLRHNSLQIAAQLQGDSRVGRWLVFLHWQSEEGSRWQAIWPDMTDAQAFRRLKVWACWCREMPLAHADNSIENKTA